MTRAAKAVTTTVPIVMTVDADAVSGGTSSAAISPNRSDYPSVVKPNFDWHQFIRECILTMEI